MNGFFRKIAALLISAALLLTIAIGCGTKADQPTSNTSAATTQAAQATTAAAATAEKPDPFGKMAEPVTLHTGWTLPAEPKYPNDESIDNNDVVNWLRDNLNITVKFDWTTSDQNYAYENKINLNIASNDIPDFLVVNEVPYGAGILRKLVDSGLIEDVTQLYNDWASPILKEYHSKSDNISMQPVTFNGKLMAIPSLADIESYAPIMWYRKDMFDQAGLQEPKTVDDVINAVKILNDKKVTDKANLPTQQNIYKSDTCTLDWLFGAYNAYPGNWIKGKDGSIVYGSIQPETKAALAKAQEMYKEGIIPKDFALSDGNKAIEPIVQNKVGIFQGAWWSTWWPLQDTMKNNPKGVWKACMIASGDGNYYSWSLPVVRSYLVVKKGLEHPEAVMKLVNVGEDIGLKKYDWFNKLRYNDDSKYKETQGALFPFGVTPGAKYLDEISRKYTNVMQIVNGGTNDDAEAVEIAKQVVREQQQPLQDFANWSQAHSWTEGAAVFKKVDIQQNIPAFDGSTELMQKNKAVLDDLEKQTFMKIIMGQASIDEFDNFADQWNKLGGQDITKEVNTIAGSK